MHHVLDQPSDQPSTSSTTSPMLYTFFSVQFTALTSVIKDMQLYQDAQFKLLEQKVDTKLPQLESKGESTLNQFEYRIVSKLHQIDESLSGQFNTIHKDHFHFDKRFRTVVENVKEVIKLVGQHIGKLNDHFSLHNDQLQIVAQHFQESKENHNKIVLCMIEPLDKLAVDMTYVVSTLKA